jgi:hypothetical protein
MNETNENPEKLPTPEELGLKKFEVRFGMGANGVMQKAVFIDGEMLDWKIDISSYMDAVKMGPHFRREIQRDIEIHFCESVSDFLGRKVTINQIKAATKTGWI